MEDIELNYRIINENVSEYLSDLSVNHPDFSIAELKKTLTQKIGQEPAIEIKYRKKVVPINEFVKKVGGKIIHSEKEVDEINVYYVDLENHKPIKIRMIF